MVNSGSFDAAGSEGESVKAEFTQLEDDAAEANFTAVMPETAVLEITPSPDKQPATSLQCSVPLDKVKNVLELCNNKSKLNNYFILETYLKQKTNEVTTEMVDPSKPAIKRLMCLFCDRTFASNNLKQKHVDRCHSSGQIRRSSSRTPSHNQTTACCFCSKLNHSDHTLKQLLEHLIHEHSNRYFACLPCEERFGSVQALRDHNRSVHNLQDPVESKASSPTPVSTETVSCDSETSTGLSASEVTRPELKRTSSNESTSKSENILLVSSNENSSPSCASKTKPLKRNSSLKKISTPETNEQDKNSEKSNGFQEDFEVAIHVNVISQEEGKKADAPEEIDVEDLVLTRRVKNNAVAKTKNTNKRNKIVNKKISVKSTKSGLRLRSSLRTTRASVKQVNNNLIKKRKKKIVQNESESKKEKVIKKSESNPASVFSLVNAYTYKYEKIYDHASDSIKDANSVQFNAVFDREFYTRTVCNIHDNLLHHVDGKLNRNIESESRISNFEHNASVSEIETKPANNKVDNFGCNLSLNAITPVATLLGSSQYGEDFDAQIEYGAKASQKNRNEPKKIAVVKYKFPNKKYNSLFRERDSHNDLTCLDMWTQLSVKKRQHKLNEDGIFSEDLLHYIRPTGEANHQVEELNRILDTRGPFEDLRKEANAAQFLELRKKSAKDGDHISEEASKEVYSVLEDLLNRVMCKCSENTANKTEIVAEENEENQEALKSELAQNMELPSYLQLQKCSSDSEEFKIDQTDSIALICSSQDEKEMKEKKRLELSGEWARPRIYVCATCGLKLPNLKSLEDHKNVSHPHIWGSHYEFVGKQSQIYRHLSIPGLGKVGVVESLPVNRLWQRSDARVCSKCSKQCHNLGELHKHILECGGDWTWMLARKKCKYRPYGARTRRRRQRGYKRSCNPEVNRAREHKAKIKPIFIGPRPKPSKPSDAETIQRMLANLPAKRNRKMISMRDGIQRPRKPYKQKLNNQTSSISQSSKSSNKKVHFKNNSQVSNQTLRNALKRKISANKLRQQNKNEVETDSSDTPLTLRSRIKKVNKDTDTAETVTEIDISQQLIGKRTKIRNKRMISRILGSKIFDSNSAMATRRKIVKAITQNNLIRKTRLRSKNIPQPSSTTQKDEAQTGEVEEKPSTKNKALLENEKKNKINPKNVNNTDENDSKLIKNDITDSKSSESGSKTVKKSKTNSFLSILTKSNKKTKIPRKIPIIDKDKPDTISAVIDEVVSRAWKDELCKDKLDTEEKNDDKNIRRTRNSSSLLKVDPNETKNNKIEEIAENKNENIMEETKNNDLVTKDSDNKSKKVLDKKTNKFVQNVKSFKKSFRKQNRKKPEQKNEGIASKLIRTFSMKGSKRKKKNSKNDIQVQEISSNTETIDQKIDLKKTTTDVSDQLEEPVNEIKTTDLEIVEKQCNTKDSECKSNIDSEIMPTLEKIEPLPSIVSSCTSVTSIPILCPINVNSCENNVVTNTEKQNETKSDSEICSEVSDNITDLMSCDKSSANNCNNSLNKFKSKIKRSGRGLNDCIAMLKCKLEQKFPTNDIPSLVDKSNLFILNSSEVIKHSQPVVQEKIEIIPSSSVESTKINEDALTNNDTVKEDERSNINLKNSAENISENVNIHKVLNESKKPEMKCMSVLEIPSVKINSKSEASTSEMSTVETQTQTVDEDIVPNAALDYISANIQTNFQLSYVLNATLQNCLMECVKNKCEELKSENKNFSLNLKSNKNKTGTKIGSVRKSTIRKPIKNEMPEEKPKHIPSHIPNIPVLLNTAFTKKSTPKKIRTKISIKTNLDSASNSLKAASDTSDDDIPLSKFVSNSPSCTKLKIKLPVAKKKRSSKKHIAFTPLILNNQDSHIPQISLQERIEQRLSLNNSMNDKIEAIQNEVAAIKEIISNDNVTESDASELIVNDENVRSNERNVEETVCVTEELIVKATEESKISEDIPVDLSNKNEPCPNDKIKETLLVLTETSEEHPDKMNNEERTICNTESLSTIKENSVESSKLDDSSKEILKRNSDRLHIIRKYEETINEVANFKEPVINKEVIDSLHPLSQQIMTVEDEPCDSFLVNKTLTEANIKPATPIKNTTSSAENIEYINKTNHVDSGKENSECQKVKKQKRVIKKQKTKRKLVKNKIVNLSAEISETVTDIFANNLDQTADEIKDDLCNPATVDALQINTEEALDIQKPKTKRKRGRGKIVNLTVETSKTTAIVSTTDLNQSEEKTKDDLLITSVDDIPQIKIKETLDLQKQKVKRKRAKSKIVNLPAEMSEPVNEIITTVIDQLTSPEKIENELCNNSINNDVPQISTNEISNIQKQNTRRKRGRSKIVNRSVETSKSVADISENDLVHTPDKTEDYICNPSKDDTPQIGNDENPDFQNQQTKEKHSQNKIVNIPAEISEPFTDLSTTDLDQTAEKIEDCLYNKSMDTSQINTDENPVVQKPKTKAKRSRSKIINVPAEISEPFADISTTDLEQIAEKTDDYVYNTSLDTSQMSTDENPDVQKPQTRAKRSRSKIVNVQTEISEPVGDISTTDLDQSAEKIEVNVYNISVDTSQITTDENLDFQKTKTKAKRSRSKTVNVQAEISEPVGDISTTDLNQSAEKNEVKVYNISVDTSQISTDENLDIQKPKTKARRSRSKIVNVQAEISEPFADNSTTDIHQSTEKTEVNIYNTSVDTSQTSTDENLDFQKPKTKAKRSRNKIVNVPAEISEPFTDISATDLDQAAEKTEDCVYNISMDTSQLSTDENQKPKTKPKRSRSKIVNVPAEISEPFADISTTDLEQAAEKTDDYIYNTSVDTSQMSNDENPDVQKPKTKAKRSRSKINNVPAENSESFDDISTINLDQSTEKTEVNVNNTCVDSSQISTDENLYFQKPKTKAKRSRSKINNVPAENSESFADISTTDLDQSTEKTEVNVNNTSVDSSQISTDENSDFQKPKTKAKRSRSKINNVPAENSESFADISTTDLDQSTEKTEVNVNNTSVDSSQISTDENSDFQKPKTKVKRSRSKNVNVPAEISERFANIFTTVLDQPADKTEDTSQISTDEKPDFQKPKTKTKRSRSKIVNEPAEIIEPFADISTTDLDQPAEKTKDCIYNTSVDTTQTSTDENPDFQKPKTKAKRSRSKIVNEQAEISESFADFSTTNLDQPAEKIEDYVYNTTMDITLINTKENPDFRKPKTKAKRGRSKVVNVPPEISDPFPDISSTDLDQSAEKTDDFVYKTTMDITLISTNENSDLPKSKAKRGRSKIVDEPSEISEPFADISTTDLDQSADKTEDFVYNTTMDITLISTNENPDFPKLKIKAKRGRSKVVNVPPEDSESIADTTNLDQTSEKFENNLFNTVDDKLQISTDENPEFQKPKIKAKRGRNKVVNLPAENFGSFADISADDLNQPAEKIEVNTCLADVFQTSIDENPDFQNQKTKGKRGRSKIGNEPPEIRGNPGRSIISSEVNELDADISTTDLNQSAKNIEADIYTFIDDVLQTTTDETPYIQKQKIKRKRGKSKIVKLSSDITEPIADISTTDLDQSAEKNDDDVCNISTDKDAAQISNDETPDFQKQKNGEKRDNSKIENISSEISEPVATLDLLEKSIENNSYCIDETPDIQEQKTKNKIDILAADKGEPFADISPSDVDQLLEKVDNGICSTYIANAPQTNFDETPDFQEPKTRGKRGKNKINVSSEVSEPIDNLDLLTENIENDLYNSFMDDDAPQTSIDETPNIQKQKTKRKRCKNKIGNFAADIGEMFADISTTNVDQLTETINVDVCSTSLANVPQTSSNETPDFQKSKTRRKRGGSKIDVSSEINEPMANLDLLAENIEDDLYYNSMIDDGPKTSTDETPDIKEQRTTRKRGNNKIGNLTKDIGKLFADISNTDLDQSSEKNDDDLSNTSMADASQTSTDETPDFQKTKTRGKRGKNKIVADISTIDLNQSAKNIEDILYNTSMNDALPKTTLNIQIQKTKKKRGRSKIVNLSTDITEPIVDLNQFAEKNEDNLCNASVDDAPQISTDETPDQTSRSKFVKNSTDIGEFFADFSPTDLDQATEKIEDEVHNNTTNNSSQISTDETPNESLTNSFKSQLQSYVENEPEPTVMENKNIHESSLISENIKTLENIPVEQNVSSDSEDELPLALLFKNQKSQNTDSLTAEDNIYLSESEFDNELEKEITDISKLNQTTTENDIVNNISNIEENLFNVELTQNTTDEYSNKFTSVQNEVENSDYKESQILEIATNENTFKIVENVNNEIYTNNEIQQEINKTVNEISSEKVSEEDENEITDEVTDNVEPVEKDNDQNTFLETHFDVDNEAETAIINFENITPINNDNQINNISVPIEKSGEEVFNFLKTPLNKQNSDDSSLITTPDLADKSLVIKIKTNIKIKIRKPKKNRRRVIPKSLSKYNIKRKEKEEEEFNIAFICDICNKTFKRKENLTSHKKTLTHIAKLSEIEARESIARRINEKDENNDDSTINEIEENNEDLTINEEENQIIKNQENENFEEIYEDIEKNSQKEEKTEVNQVTKELESESVNNEENVSENTTINIESEIIQSNETEAENIEINLDETDNYKQSEIIELDDEETDLNDLIKNDELLHITENLPINVPIEEKDIIEIEDDSSADSQAIIIGDDENSINNNETEILRPIEEILHIEPQNQNTNLLPGLIVSSNSNLKLVDIISQVLDKPVTDLNIGEGNYLPQHISRSSHSCDSNDKYSEPKRYKSLGERKSFDSDNFTLAPKCNEEVTTKDNYNTSLSSVNNGLLSKQLSLLENIIEETSPNLNYIDDSISLSSNQFDEPVEQNISEKDLFKPEYTKLLNPQIQFSHNADVLSSFIKPNSHFNNFGNITESLPKPIKQFQEVTRPTFEEEQQKKSTKESTKRKILNRDEELFLECCSLLKSGSEISAVSKKSTRNIPLNNFSRSNDASWIIQKQPNSDQFIQRDSYSWLAQSSRVDTPIGEPFVNNDWSNSNSGVSSEWLAQKAPSPDRPTENNTLIKKSNNNSGETKYSDIQFEDISIDSSLETSKTLMAVDSSNTENIPLDFHHVDFSNKTFIETPEVNQEIEESNKLKVLPVVELNENIENTSSSSRAQEASDTQEIQTLDVVESELKINEDAPNTEEFDSDLKRKVVTAFGGLMAKALSNRLHAVVRRSKKTKGKRDFASAIQASITDFAVPLKKNKLNHTDSDSSDCPKKLMTKGAMKVFEGLKVSIPTQDLNLKEVLNYSNKPKNGEIVKPENEPVNNGEMKEDVILEKKNEKVAEISNKNGKIKSLFGRFGNKLGLRETKKKTNKHRSKSKNHINNKTIHDVYEFEESMESNFMFKAGKFSLFRKREQNTEKMKNVETTKEVGNERTDTKFNHESGISSAKWNGNDSDSDTDRYYDSMSFEEMSISSESTHGSDPNLGKIKPVQKRNSEKSKENQKKCMIMGRIFKNASKPKLEDKIPEIRDISSEENSKLVENYPETYKSVDNVENTNLQEVPTVPNNVTVNNSANKMSKIEMDLLFDKLLEEEKKHTEENVLGSIISVEKEQPNPEVFDHPLPPPPEKFYLEKKKIKEGKTKISGKTKKRHRFNSGDSISSDEFTLGGKPSKSSKKHHKTPRKSTKVKKDTGINLEQEMKECIGVAGRKSQRKCTSGKQNVLMEYWSSDESSFEEVIKLLGKDSAPIAIVEEEKKPDAEEELSYLEPEEPLENISSNSNHGPPIVEIIDNVPQNNVDIYEFDSDVDQPIQDHVKIKIKLNEPILKPETDFLATSKIRIPKKTKRIGKSRKHSKSHEGESDDTEYETEKNRRREHKRKKSVENCDILESESNPDCLAVSRKKRNAGDQLYYWSSSSDDEFQDLIEVKPIREDTDDDRPMQHGWIVGDSPKKLVTMLAQAKGKKVEGESVKEQGKKNRVTL